ncbi:hypothetical protein [Mangrovicoccus ximenensis]|uniref:hypothetical protein n=1 Tax=Mangrovicoccus ximenensis TaxID=1911570 RepID=UPI000D3D324C|nr:hypothetical protein [Mangrovicoccus ximenensis]
MEKFKVIRPHIGDRYYAPGETREIDPKRAAHLVRAGVLVADEGAAEQAEAARAAAEKAAAEQAEAERAAADKPAAKKPAAEKAAK